MLDVPCEPCEQTEPAVAQSKLSPTEAAPSTSGDMTVSRATTQKRGATAGYPNTAKGALLYIKITYHKTNIMESIKGTLNTV